MTIDVMSLVYGMVIGVIPTVIVMIIANMADDVRNKK